MEPWSELVGIIYTVVLRIVIIAELAHPIRQQYDRSNNNQYLLVHTSPGNHISNLD